MDLLVAKCPLEKEKKFHWIEIELLDDDTGEPVKGEPYRIKLTDGIIYEGTLNDQGRARYDYIEAGTCYVWFPSIDGIAWNESVSAEGDPEESTPPSSIHGVPIHTTGWIDVRLEDESGQPILGERYELELADGKIEKGVTDELGGVFFDDIELGTCRISFPDLDGDAWEAA